MKTLFVIGMMLTMVLLALLTTAQNADTSLKAIYDQQTIYLVGNKYIKNGEKKNSGIFFQRLRKEFVNISPETEQEISVAVRQGKFATIFSGSALVLFYGGLFTLGTLGETGALVSLGAMTGGFILFVPSIIYGISAQRHICKSVWLHNRDIITKQ